MKGRQTRSHGVRTDDTPVTQKRESFIPTACMVEQDSIKYKNTTYGGYTVLLRPISIQTRNYKKGIPVTIAWSRSYGSSVICSSGLNISARNALTSLSKTASGATVESIQFALIEITA